MNHINPVFEKYAEVTLNHLKKSNMKIFCHYPPKSRYLQNENNLISALKKHIVSLENKILFLQKEIETENQLISTLISTQLLTQKRSVSKELNPDCEELNEKSKIEKKNIVHNTCNRKAYTDIPSSSIAENTIQCNNAQNIETKRNIQNETSNTINLNPSNIAKCELVREDTSSNKSNPSIQ